MSRLTPCWRLTRNSRENEPLGTDTERSVVGAKTRPTRETSPRKGRRSANAARGFQGTKALWFLHRAAPESPAYHTAFAARIVSEIDPAVLRSVFQALVDRHPALRTTFTVHGGEPMQEVHAFRAVSFEHVDAANWSAEDLDRGVARSYRRPFDLAQGPLFRVVLFSRAARDYVLLLTFHHSICDAWSIWLLLDEFRQLYPAVAARQPGRLPPPAATFADFVDWQRQMLEGPDGERLLTYWEKQLSGELPTLDLPAGSPQSLSSDSVRGGDRFFPLSRDCYRGLKTLARAQGTTLYSVLLAAFQVLLHRYTGQEDIIVGSPMAGRTQAAFEGVVGYFVNPIPLRANLTGEPPFAVFLQQVRRTVLDALAHQDYPFSLLVERLQPRRTGNRSPIFQVLFVFQKPQESSGLTGLLAPDRGSRHMMWGGLEVEPFPLAQMEGQFDLTLEIAEDGGCALKYRMALHDESTIRRMAEHFLVLLKSIVLNPDCRVSQLAVLGEAERRQIVADWNDTGVDYPRKRCVHEMIEEQVARTPEAPCVEFEAQRWNYRELNERANGIAHWLRGRGAGGKCWWASVSSALSRWLPDCLGFLNPGAAYVPLDPSQPRERLQFMLSDSGVNLVLTQRKFASELTGRHAELLFIDEPLRASDLGNPESGVTAEQIAYMIYTSGSTGRPKGALNTHGGLCNRLLWMQDRYRLTAADCVLQKTPFSFDVSIWEFFWPLMTGARLVLAKPGGHQDRGYLIELIAARGATVLHFVPSMLQTFLEGSEVEECGSVRHVFCSGEALSPDLEERFFAVSGAELHNLYGPTEAAIDVSFWDCERENRRSTCADWSSYCPDADLHPRPTARASAHRCRRGALHRWRRACPRILEAARTHRGNVYSKPVWPTWHAALSDRRPRSDAGRWHDRIPRATRLSGQDPRLSRRARRDRGGACAASSCARSRRCHANASPGAAIGGISRLARQ